MPIYAPEAPPQSVDPELQEYLVRELNRIGNSIDRTEAVVLASTTVAPAKPEEGSIVYADGVTFNPGLGEGIYAYINGAWVKLSSSAADMSVQFIGCIQDFGGIEANIPTFWLACFGQSLLRAGQYAPLFGKIGTTHGAADGTHFNVPDYRGRVGAGQDDMGGTSANRLTGPLDGDTLGAVGGFENIALSIAELAAHTHGPNTLAGTTNTELAHSHATVGGHLSTGGAILGLVRTSAGSAMFQAAGPTVGAGAHSHTMTLSSGVTTSTGSGTAHDNVQPTIIVNKIIYAGA